jgi:hypothetical protein
MRLTTHSLLDYQVDMQQEHWVEHLVTPTGIGLGSNFPSWKIHSSRTKVFFVVGSTSGGTITFNNNNQEDLLGKIIFKHI